MIAYRSVFTKLRKLSRCTVATVGVWLLLCALGGGWARAQQTDDSIARYFAGLRARRLHALAEQYGRAQLARDDLSSDERLELTLELSRTLSESAEQAGAAQRAALWLRAQQLIDRFLKEHPQHARHGDLQLQSASIPAAQGRALRWQVELLPYDNALRQQAVAVLNAAAERLRSMKQDFDEGAGANGKATGPAGKLLLARTRYALGETLVDLAVVSEVDSAERLAALIEAEKLLRSQPTNTTRAVDPQSRRLLLARTLRLRGQQERALGILESMLKEEPAPAMADTIAAEIVRTLLGLNRPRDAAKVVDKYVLSGRRRPAEIEFLNVLVLVTEWETALEQQADGLEALIAEEVERLREKIPGYWAERAAMRLELGRESARWGRKLAYAIRNARTLYAAGDLDAAIAAYGQAAGEAFQDGNQELAFDLAYTRASIQLRGRKYSAGQRSFQELVDRFPENPRRADAQLLVAYALGQQYAQRSTKSSRQAYTEALETHRKEYSDHPTAGEATWMLARLQEQRFQTTVALKLYQEIPAGHTRGHAAQVAIARCYETILKRLQTLRRPVGQWQDRAVTELQSFLQSDRADAPLKLHQLQVSIHLARILLNQQRPDFANADRILARIFKDSSSSRTEPVQRIAAEATQLRIVSLAGQNRLSEASGLLKQLSTTDSARMLRILDGLSQLLTGASDEISRELGNLQLQAAVQLAQRRAKLSPDAQVLLDRCLAQAYAATDRIDEAVEVYESLVKSHPKDPGLSVSLGETLIRCGNTVCIKKALRVWSGLERRFKPGTPPWINARYHRALCLFEQKRFDACSKLLEVTRLLYPDLGTEELRAQVAELAKRCAKRN